MISEHLFWRREKVVVVSQFISNVLLANFIPVKAAFFVIHNLFDLVKCAFPLKFLSLCKMEILIMC